MLRTYVTHLEWRGVLPSSIEARMRVLSRFESWLDGQPIETATVDQLRTWLESHRDLAARTRYCYVSHVACFWRWLVLEGHAETDITLRVARPKLRRGLPRPVSTEDVATALSAAQDGPMRAMLALAAFAGLRCAEISGMERTDVLERKRPTPLLVITHAKGGRERIVPMHHVVRQALLAMPMPARGRLFEWSPEQVSGRMRRHLHGCGIEASAHQLRHWFATEAYELSGGDLRMLQELLGHASPTTTAIYTAWSQTRAFDVVNALAA
jgi:integrase/recombinase XerC